MKTQDNKAKLSEALKLAQIAVKYDEKNEYPEALENYGKALNLISEVLVNSNMKSSGKLISIQQSYLDRVHLLSSYLNDGIDNSKSSFISIDEVLNSNKENSAEKKKNSYDRVEKEIVRMTESTNIFIKPIPDLDISLNHALSSIPLVLFYPNL